MFSTRRFRASAHRACDDVHFFDKSEAGGVATPSRAEVNVADTWDLAALYPAPEDWGEDFARLQKEADFDATAVRVARLNAKVNGIKRVVFKRFDVQTGRPDPRWDVVLAKVYGPILIQAAPQIARAVAPGGTLIISGIPREQAEDVLAAFRGQADGVRARRLEGKIGHRRCPRAASVVRG